MQTTETSLNERIRRDLVDLTTVRDEIRLQIHLAGMDAKGVWADLEARIGQLESRVEAEGQAVGRATADLATEIARAVRRFRRRIAS